MVRAEVGRGQPASNRSIGHVAQRHASHDAAVHAKANDAPRRLFHHDEHPDEHGFGHHGTAPSGPTSRRPSPADAERGRPDRAPHKIATREECSRILESGTHTRPRDSCRAETFGEASMDDAKSERGHRGRGSARLRGYEQARRSARLGSPLLASRRQGEEKVGDLSTTGDASKVLVANRHTRPDLNRGWKSCSPYRCPCCQPYPLFC